ncbi:MAG: hypothetical protein JWR12_806 [Mucilaginibacter sp.]|nr:hypothetical protein [Mucilaginibacter sp.]
MIKKSSTLNKLIILVFFQIFVSSNGFSQILTSDTLKNTDKYSKYILLSKQMLASIKKNKISVINKYFEYPGLHNKKTLKYELSWVHKLLQNPNNVALQSVVLEKSDIPFSGLLFKMIKLRITYSLGRSGCIDQTFNNTITISFYDVSKEENHFELSFENCRESEKLKREILAIPVPKN